MNASSDTKVNTSTIQINTNGLENYEVLDNNNSAGVDIKITDESNTNSRDIEKQEVLNKQRENYLNNENKRTSSGDTLSSFFDSHNEILYYLLGIELFFIFLTYSHYQYFDKKNKFLTPIVMGSETSLLGKTLILLYKCYKNPRSFQNSKYRANDEENSILGLSNSDNINLNISQMKSGNMHSRNTSNVDKLFSPKLTPSLSISEINNESPHIQDENLKEHLKFMIWGGLNGLLSSYWIEFVVNLFPNMKLACVLLDQTIGTIIFQTLYSLFICLWDWEIESLNSVDFTTNSNIELTWDSFIDNYSKVLWKYMKLSWMIWPFVSLCCFTLLPETWIFPVNCIFTTVFSVLLGM